MESRGVRVPGLFYADDVALLSPSAQGLQQLLDTMQSFCVTNGLTISVLKTEVVVFGGGHQQCQWHVGGHRLKRSESFIYLGMLFHEDRHIKHAVQHRLARGYAAQGSIFSRYAGLGCANSVQLLVRLQQAILQPCASYACEVWAPASACIGPFRNLQQLQRAFLCRACRVKKSVPVDIIFQELQQMRWHDFWWRRVSGLWSALVEADTGSLHSIIFTPVFKKGDESDTSNYRPIAVGEPLCRLYAAILNSRIVNWAETNGLRAPCQAGFRPRLSTEHQLFALRHFIDRSKSQKQPLFAAFVDLKKAYDSVQHPLLWAALQRKGIHGKMLAGIQSLYDGGDMSMKISGSSGASGTARVGVRQGCPLSPTLFGIFFDSLDAQLQAESAAAGVECRGVRVPGLFYADDVALLSPSAQGLQQLLDTMQSFCVTNGLTISVLKTEVVVFGGGHQQCQWHVGGHRLKRSESFIYLGMLFHEDRHIKHAVQHRLARGYAAQGSIFSRYAGLGCANSVQLLVRLQQAILQPCASYACEVWAPASACIGPFRNLQQLQRAFLRRACRVKTSVPVDIIFQELQQMRWHDFWWRRVSSFWSALVEADTGSLHSIIFHDAIQLALAGCKFSWAAQVLQCFSALDEPLPLVAGAPIAIDIDLLQELFLRDRLASFDSLPQDPRLAPSAGVKLCTYHRWFGRPQNAACPSYWESPMGNAKLHRILRFRMGSHHLPVEEGRHFNLPRASRVCNLCNTDALGDERHMLLECPALADLRLQFSSLLLPCSGVMRRLLWAKDQHEVCRYIIACLDRMSSH